MSEHDERLAEALSNVLESVSNAQDQLANNSYEMRRELENAMEGLLDWVKGTRKYLERRRGDDMAQALVDTLDELNCGDSSCPDYVEYNVEYAMDQYVGNAMSPVVDAVRNLESEMQEDPLTQLADDPGTQEVVDVLRLLATEIAR